jgi:hypothetical protein
MKERREVPKYFLFGSEFYFRLFFYQAQRHFSYLESDYGCQCKKFLTEENQSGPVFLYSIAAILWRVNVKELMHAIEPENERLYTITYSVAEIFS